jgi:glycosyltransferase involved in cell wall biosynthesis
VGSNPPEAIRKLSSDPIVVTGFVEDLEPFYRQSRVFVVPHQYAGGIPLKLLEAMGQGLPAVVSTIIIRTLGFPRMEKC